MRGQALVWSEAHIEFLRIVVPGTPWATVHEWFEEEFATGRSMDDVKRLCKRRGILNGRDSRIQPGSVPPNKGRIGWSAPGTEATRFKKGNRPHTYVPVGSYRLTTARTRFDRRNQCDYVVPAYWQLKVADTVPARHGWKFLHRLIWENEYGPIPPGGNVVFVDGDTMNVSIDNLMMLTRGALAIVNRHHAFSQAPAELRRTILLTAQVQAAAGERSTGVVAAPDGVVAHLRDHAKRYGLEHGTVYARIRKSGWTVAEALTTPLGEKPARVREQRRRARERLPEAEAS